MESTTGKFYTHFGKMQLSLRNHISHKSKVAIRIETSVARSLVQCSYCSGINTTVVIRSHIIVLTCLPLSTVRTTPSSYLGGIGCIPSDISRRQGDLPFTERGIGQQQRGPGGRRKEEGRRKGGGREEEGARKWEEREEEGGGREEEGVRKERGKGEE